MSLAEQQFLPIEYQTGHHFKLLAHQFFHEGRGKMGYS
jgi:hypothetical protein